MKGLFLDVFVREGPRPNSCYSDIGSIVCQQKLLVEGGSVYLGEGVSLDGECKMLDNQEGGASKAQTVIGRISSVQRDTLSVNLRHRCIYVMSKWVCTLIELKVVKESGKFKSLVEWFATSLVKYSIQPKCTFPFLGEFEIALGNSFL